MEKNAFELSNRLYKLLLVVGIGAALALFLGAYASWTNARGDYPREISVSADGRAFIKPDIAMVNLGVYNEGKDAKEVISDNNNKMKNITDAIKKIGIDAKDIRTSDYYFSPKYNWNDDRGSFVDGYTINQDIEVKIRDFDQINEVLQKAGEAGADNISQLNFTVDDPQKAKEEAMIEAVTKAKEKARSISKASGLKLGKLVDVYESGYNQPAPMYSVNKDMGGMGGGEMVSAPDIQPGEQEVNVTMSLTYRIK